MLNLVPPSHSSTNWLFHLFWKTRSIDHSWCGGETCDVLVLNHCGNTALPSCLRHVWRVSASEVALSHSPKDPTTRKGGVRANLDFGTPSATEARWHPTESGISDMKRVTKQRRCKEERVGFRNLGVGWKAELVRTTHVGVRSCSKEVICWVQVICLLPRTWHFSLLIRRQINTARAVPFYALRDTQLQPWPIKHVLDFHFATCLACVAARTSAHLT